MKMHLNRSCQRLFAGARNYSSCSATGFKLNPRPFEDIPGPKSLPIVGTLYKYLPYIGEYNFDKLHKNGLKKLNKYGPLVKEEIVPGVNIIWVYQPNDIAEIFKVEIGKYPERRSHLALFKYRTDRSNVYNSGGLLPTNGPDWWRIRKEFQKALSKPQNIVNYIDLIDDIVRQFVKLCGDKKYDDLLPLISRLFLELTCLVAFDVSMNSFSQAEMQSNSRSSKLIDAALTSNSAILQLDHGIQLWKYFKTPLYKKFCNHQKFMEDVAIELVNKKIDDIKNKPASENKSLLEIYLKNENLNVKDVVGMACDTILAGVDTTSYSLAFALYHLGNNSKALEKLQSEAERLLANDAPITAATLRDASYTKAVIKETFRMNPISVGVGRILAADTILNNFHVPAGTVVVTQNQVTCRLPEFFYDPNSFLPERWLRDDNNKTNNGVSVHPYLVLPFGHGRRSCIARRLAEQNLQMVLLRLSKEYNYTWKGGNLDSLSLLINKPDLPIKIDFTSKNNM